MIRSLGIDEFINANTERFEDKATNLDVILDLVGMWGLDFCPVGAMPT